MATKLTPSHSNSKGRHIWSTVNIISNDYKSSNNDQQQYYTPNDKVPTSYYFFYRWDNWHSTQNHPPNSNFCYGLLITMTKRITLWTTPSLLIETPTLRTWTIIIQNSCNSQSSKSKWIRIFIYEHDRIISDSERDNSPNPGKPILESVLRQQCLNSSPD